eukprot:TRINITY_DN2288_c0_g1_i1.p1 TRINITY_DN2288_c0_g1~~TRINITY_DN2288_c0_g1_i1.p1  ORF type:complete len:210 (+),score=46.17 TRINITY_DN2288_c0_g1_i1:68-697(+)
MKILGLVVVLACLGMCVAFDRCPDVHHWATVNPSLSKFDPNLYQGRWFELAYFDLTQFSVCGCTRLDWSYEPTNRTYNDMFTTRCPMNPSWLSKDYHTPMNGTVDATLPYHIPETGFSLTFNNAVIYFEVDDNNQYTNAVQFQCDELSSGVRTFTGINLLTRHPLSSDAERGAVINHLIGAVSALGLPAFTDGLTKLTVVSHNNCTYSP